MYATVERKITFEAAHRLQHHAGACKNVHGHSYTVAAMLGGEVDSATGMVVDFKVVNGILRGELLDDDHGWDHALLVSESDPLLDTFQTLQAAGLRVRVLDFEPTAENMARHLAERIADQAPESVRIVTVSVWETADSRAICTVSRQDGEESPT